MITRKPLYYLRCDVCPTYYHYVSHHNLCFRGIARYRPTWPHVPMLKTRLKPILKASAPSPKKY